MRLYRHIKVEYTCANCRHGRTLIESAYSTLDGLAIVLAAVPVVAVAMRRPWSFPWYCVVPVLAAELLALIAAGILASFILQFDRRRCINVCSECGGVMFLAGRHFDPAGDKAPHHSDFVVLAVFVAMNVLFWVVYLSGKLSA